MELWLIPLSLVLVSVLVTVFSLQQGKPILGFALGTLPFFLLWLALSLAFEWSLYQCRLDITANCEWTGPGLFLATLIAYGLVALAAVILIGFDLAHLFLTRRSIAGAPRGGSYPWPLWAALLVILTAGGIGLAFGFVLSDLLGALTAFWVVPMLALAGAASFMVYQERKFRQK